jgi:hypothetical protein
MVQQAGYEGSMDDGERVSILRVRFFSSNAPKAGADQIVNIARRRDLYLPLCVPGFRVF